jgi:hypothetical protein
MKIRRRIIAVRRAKDKNGFAIAITVIFAGIVLWVTFDFTAAAALAPAPSAGSADSRVRR